MDHLEAVRSQITEKYLLGELRGEAREEFEDHFFECEVCSEAVRTGVLFLDNAAAEMQPAPARQAAKAPQKSWKDWFSFDWRQPAFALPVLALAAVSALWLNDHSRLRQALDSASVPQSFADVQLDVARGNKSASVSRQEHFFAVSFYIDPDTLPDYTIGISGSGAGPATVLVPHRQNQRYHILLPSSRYQPGSYVFTVRGGPGTDGRLIQQFALSLE